MLFIKSQPLYFRLPPSIMLVSCLAYFSTLNMDVICSSETSIDFQETTWHIPEDRTLHCNTFTTGVKLHGDTCPRYVPYHPGHAVLETTVHHIVWTSDHVNSI